MNDETTTTSPRSLWGRWVLANAWSEMVGLGGGAVLGVWLLSVLERGPITGLVASTLAFGLLEGGVVGWAQHRVLENALPYLKRSTWIGWTVFGAVVAWLAVNVPMRLFGDQMGIELEWWVETLGAAGVGLAAGPILGVPQAIALREWVARPYWWVLANALAWAVGMPVVFAAAGPVSELGVPLVFPAAAGVLLAAGAVVGAVHGAFLVRMVTPDPRGVEYTGQALDAISSIDLENPPQ